MSIKPLVNLVADDQVKGQAKEIFEKIKASTGSVPKWMRVMANCEDIMVGFFILFKATMDDKPLPADLKWKVAYRISEINKCEFCVSVAEQQLKSFGLKDEDIKTIEEVNSEKEKVALQYAEASTRHAYNIDPAIMDKMKEHYNDEEIVEISSVVGVFNFINRFNDSLGILPDVD